MADTSVQPFLAPSAPAAMGEKNEFAGVMHPATGEKNEFVKPTSWCCCSGWFCAFCDYFWCAPCVMQRLSNKSDHEVGKKYASWTLYTFCAMILTMIVNNALTIMVQEGIKEGHVAPGLAYTSLVCSFLSLPIAIALKVAHVAWFMATKEHLNVGGDHVASMVLCYICCHPCALRTMDLTTDAVVGPGLMAKEYGRVTLKNKLAPAAGQLPRYEAC